MEIKLQQNILASNNKIAADLRKIFEDKGIYVINLMASPGAGKTSFILQTIENLKNDLNIAVIEGDIASKVDAEKVREHGVTTIQINTGGACHLDANMIRGTLGFLNLDETDLIIIENVGNLVCPAEFDLGETVKMVILSVPEGDDKPLKYPRIFIESEVLVLNKIDLLDYTDFDINRLKGTVNNLNPDINIFEISCKSADGIDSWISWLKDKIRKHLKS
ncbi:hydrogenase nickel incorporation protein HypB [Candidatus Oleimmundimicrobium sp.]|uniref:hydrogenase nickel incorporation protein HypB n=1 Tax=Candidatus Oleimmundimicrobium sp. TaxID=3060597 RepID=UPI00271A180D|nr:hydrogenase nickel incorporation protein HypB [Candidatus Oleimmundimicrobium sp.]MDO8886320.1 hydrogenase nickel incorporation protein HypB [Candidatus Oleimmundimicrobium sp.]